MARGFPRGLGRGQSEDFREDEGSIDCMDCRDRGEIAVFLGNDRAVEAGTLGT